MKLISQDTVTTKVETSVVELEDGKKVVVTNYINEKGRVDDTVVRWHDSGDDLEGEGTEGEISEKVQEFVEQEYEKEKKK